MTSCLSSWMPGAPVAQWIKRWPSDLAVLSLSPARGEIFSTVNRVLLHTAFHYHQTSAHRPDMTEILLKRTQNRKSSIHPGRLSPSRIGILF